MGSNPDTSLILCKEALKLAKISQYKRGIAGAYQLMGKVYKVLSDYGAAMTYEDSALALFTQLNDTRNIGTSNSAIGMVYYMQSDYNKAAECFLKALAIAGQQNNKYDIAENYTDLGIVYSHIGEYPKAIEYDVKALDMNERLGNKLGMARNYTNMGNIYDIQKDLKKALEYHNKALQLNKEVGSVRGVGAEYTNIGLVYQEQHNYPKALEYYFNALRIDEKASGKADIAIDYSNMGILFDAIYNDDSAKMGCAYINSGETVFTPHSVLLDSALSFENRALELDRQVGDKQNEIYILQGIASILEKKQQVDKAITYRMQAYALADSIGALDEKMEVDKGLGNDFVIKKDYKSAVNYLYKIIDLQNTIFGQDKQKLLGKQEAKFEYDKKLLEQEKEREKEHLLADEQAKRQRIITIGVTAGLIIVLGFLFLLYKRFKVTHEQKMVIEEQKKEVDNAYVRLNETHLQLQEKDKDITDSISYAKRIQTATLPSDEYLRETLGEHFVLFKPRDVVSGDFYWCHKEGDKVVFAVADCTGHGVPGAFMSMISNSLLNQVVVENKILDAASILNNLRGNLLKQMQQKGQEAVNRDGMDIALCVWNKNTNIIDCAGANNPVYVLRNDGNVPADEKTKLHNNILLEVFPDKQPIGYLEGKMDTTFTSFSLELQKGDCIYLSSDGYHDQFGGERNKKFTSRRFKEILSSLKGQSLSEQRKYLDDTIENWKGSYPQTDDICLIGVRV